MALSWRLNCGEFGESSPAVQSLWLEPGDLPMGRSQRGHPQVTPLCRDVSPPKSNTIHVRAAFVALRPMEFQRSIPVFKSHFGVITLLILARKYTICSFKRGQVHE